ncbi:DUF2306 domain-containing protein [Salinimicrobium terrae]|uniref:DUF2306 domain-containing protein n=1 Tax=Salinimicrobium terrae TaxID=470866 RepID=UPI00048FE16F|nr:DUF2306 domain-containing protein [Salinimicrobium terrae]
MPHDSIGWIHTIAAVIALITGSLVLLKTKGTFLHKMTGRVYAVSMLMVCGTAFMIYRVHNTFGILHIFALISTITLFLGMLPLYLGLHKKPVVAHLSWMYWSVIGLYCAFAAEIFTRLPTILNIKNTYGIFYALIGLSAGIVGFIGSHFFKRKKKVWEDQFGS